MDFATEAKSEFAKQVETIFKHQSDTKKVKTIYSFGKEDHSLNYACFVYQKGIIMPSEDEQRDYIWSNMLRNDEKKQTQINLVLSDNQEIIDVSIIDYRQEDIPLDRRKELLNKAEEIAQIRFQKHIAEFGRKIGRNQLCPCGSGRKYKRCCGK